jgi:hypothetical protein
MGGDRKNAGERRARLRDLIGSALKLYSTLKGDGGESPDAAGTARQMV